MKYFLGPSHISPILYSARVNVPQESLNHKTFFFFSTSKTLLLSVYFLTGPMSISKGLAWS